MTHKVNALVLAMLFEHEGVLLSRIILNKCTGKITRSIRSLVIDCASNNEFPMHNTKHHIHKIFCKYDLFRSVIGFNTSNYKLIHMETHELTFY